ncbi:RNA polymerase sigma factor [Sporosarcina koreensis]|uniref:RNA polymerase sigma factor n=1 Tax=Sporosarcina koreensis TaxID=334735 RepID=A0ABW0U0C4_9BACL
MYREEVKKGGILIEKLIKKAKRGNKTAFIQCIEPYEGDLYRMAFVYMKNEHDAVDVVQETIIKAYEKINTLKEPAHFKTWLIKIVINTCLSKLKRSEKLIHIDEKHLASLQIMTTDISLKLTLQNLIEQLTNEEKNVILLHFYQGYTFKETSELLEMPLGTAKSICYRALKKLRIQIEEVDFYE